MKVFLWITLVSLAAVAYGASIVPEPTVQRPAPSKEGEVEVLEIAGKNLETLGRLLQGKDVTPDKESQEELLEVLKALTTGEGLSEEASEYFWPIIARGVAQGAIAHGVHKWLNRKG
ncbi:uncharacterized protein LOC144124761 [Amblyomma americanum]